jgi:arylsulfatase A-like enzyme
MGKRQPFKAASWEGTWDEFETEFAGDTEKHRHWYQRAVDGTVADFEDRLATLEDRGQLEDTLVVFTSDHGEYLGEDGLVDHTSPVRPEGIYVPTVFIHPDIEGGKRASGIMRHVDLFPTILRALDEPIPSFVDGMDLARNTPERGYSLATANVYAFDAPRRVFEVASVWDADGGHVLNQAGLHRRLLATVGLFAGTDWKSKHLRRTPTESVAAARHYLASVETFGAPAFDWTIAEKIIDDVERKEPVMTEDTETLSSGTKEQLEELGYL